MAQQTEPAIPGDPPPRRKRTPVLDECLDRLRRGLIDQLPPGRFLASEESLAAWLGVSRPTIHRALQILAREGPIRWAGPHKGYCVARAPRRSSRTSGLLFPLRPEWLVTEPFFREVMVGLTLEAERQGRSVMNFCGGATGQQQAQKSLRWLADIGLVDSMIALDVFDPALIQRLARRYPVVCLDASKPMPDASSAEFDHRATLRMALKYLVDLGHRRIGLLARPPQGFDPAGELRIEAFQEACQWMGLAEGAAPCVPAGAPADVQRRLSAPGGTSPPLRRTRATTTARPTHTGCCRSPVPGRTPTRPATSSRSAPPTAAGRGASVPPWAPGTG
jgi:biotin operon repressor